MSVGDVPPFASDPGGGPGPERQRERDEMVESQLAAPPDRRAPVLDARVLQAMRRVPRHRFAGADRQDEAYADAPIAIGEGQTISQPYMVAKMTELLELPPTTSQGAPRVLEVGTGSGYQTAILAELGAKVVTVERDAALAATAQTRLAQLGYAVDVRSGDGYQGAPDAAPFDAIVVTAAPDHVPPPLIEQLAEGGRLLVPVGATASSQELLRLRKRGGATTSERLFPVRFVPMTGESEQRG